MLKKLGGGEIKQTRMTLQLTDKLIKHPYGVFEDVFVRVDKFLFPVDFMILNIEVDAELLLLIGRLFLASGRALIDVQQGKLMLRFQDEKINFNVFEAIRPNNKGCFRVDVIEDSVQEIFIHELHSPPLEKLIVNYIEDIDEDLESEIEALYFANCSLTS